MQSAQVDMIRARNGWVEPVLSHALKTKKGVCAVTDSKSNSNGVAMYRMCAAALMMVMLSIGVLQLAGVFRL
jgi:hypothetical protein